MDAVEKAHSGHPGAPMGLADVAEVLWNDFLRHNPNNPHWFNRDRFVLSNGHGSMLLYALLYLSGYSLSLQDIQQFRQLHSKTPGHPEWGITPGVETTTGPLGQGLANAVGMAIAERKLAAEFNQEGYPLIDHTTYAFVGDGCLMEGLSHEVCSLAGTLKLHKLIVFYDNNGVSIDGKVEGWFTDNTRKRFEAYAWQVIPSIDGHDPSAIKAAIIKAHAETERPSLLICNTVIGYGAPNKAGSHHCHGAPLGQEEVALARNELKWPYEPFQIPEAIQTAWDAKTRGRELEEKWQALFLRYKTAYPTYAQEFERRVKGELSRDFYPKSHTFIEKLASSKPETLSTRRASLLSLEAYAPLLPELFGGSADLSDSNLTQWSTSQIFTSLNPTGNYLYYGVREFGMSAMMNGIALHGGLIPFGGTFLVFSDYARNAVRLAALMGQRVVFVYSHDSIGLGEDGPTHQPIEHLSSLRFIPNLSVWRPSSLLETAIAWKVALERKTGPTCLALSRQNISAPSCDKMIEKSDCLVEDILKGGYIYKECPQKPHAILIATGSELPLALAASEALAPEWRVRVVSMPSCDVFQKQSEAYRSNVLLPDVACRVAIEAGTPDFWYRYVGLKGLVIGITSFGLSAPGSEVFKALGFTPQAVTERVKRYIQTYYG
ncbi:MAG: transketolase [Gammaproteobacteria bacterium]|nr:transketolase [Gammaproteobacteria bacterium]